MTFTTMGDVNAMLSQSRSVSPVLAVLAALFASALPHPAAAQDDPPRNGTRFQDWTLSCRAEAVNTTTCAITQTLVRQSDDQFLAEFGLNRVDAEEGRRTVMIVRTPAGVDLRVDPAYRIDDAEDSTSLAWRTCAGQFCSAVLALDADQTEALKQGARMLFGYQPYGRQEAMAFNVSLSGITDGLDALD